MKEFMKKFKEFSRDRKMEIISIVIIIEEINEKCQYVQQMVLELQRR